LRNGHNSSGEECFKQFSISDTSRIRKIEISDVSGKVATLTRVEGKRRWLINNRYEAREDAVNLILKTIARTSVRGNVADAAHEEMMKLIVTSAKKVAIYTDSNEPEKIWYVSVATPDHTGTVMLLELPNEGRGNVPYITHMEGFTGFLSTRFFTDEEEWRYTGVLDYPDLNISRVVFELQEATPTFMSIDLLPDGNFRIEDHSPIKVATHMGFDTSAVRNLMLSLRKAHFETYRTGLSPSKLDSVKTSMPFFVIRVTDLQGVTESVSLYRLPAIKDVLREDGTREPWNMDHYLGCNSKGEFGLAQTYTFDPMIYAAMSIRQQR
jgi:hypothetical protein